MVIDIDSFLEGYSENGAKQSSAPKKEDKSKTPKKEELMPNLDFQSSVENKLEETKKAISKHEDLESLNQIYSKLKEFDSDLPNKFFGIEEKSGEIIKEVGQKYSKEYLLKAQDNANYINKKIQELAIDCEKQLNLNQFNDCIKSFKEILFYYKSYPEELIIEKNSLNQKIKHIENKIYLKIENQKNITLKKFKNDIISKIVETKTKINLFKATELEEEINTIQEILNQIPQFFFNDIINEKIKINNFIIFAQKELVKKYNSEFQTKKQQITALIEKFHQNKLKKNLENSLTIYNEILISFKNLPKAFLKEKIELYNQIITLYTSINDELLKNNMEMILKTYENGKIIEEAKNYINFIKTHKTASLSTLKIHLEKINSLPNTIFEKELLQKKVRLIIQELTKYEIEHSKLNLRPSIKETKQTSFNKTQKQIHHSLPPNPPKLNKKIQEEKKDNIETNNLKTNNHKKDEKTKYIKTITKDKLNEKQKQSLERIKKLAIKIKNSKNPNERNLLLNNLKLELNTSPLDKKIIIQIIDKLKNK